MFMRSLMQAKRVSAGQVTRLEGFSDPLGDRTGADAWLMHTAVPVEGGEG